MKAWKLLAVMGLLVAGCERTEPAPMAPPAPATDAAQPAAEVVAVPPASVRIVTWNVREVFNDADRAARTADFKRFAAETKPDILILQEITDPPVVRAMLADMGLSSYWLAMSNFRQGDTTGHDDFEVAIASRFPLTNIMEFDPSPDNAPGDTPERKLSAPPLEGLKTPMTARGFLVARVDSLNLAVIGTHLKSSVGKGGLDDWKSSQQREFVAAAMAAEVNRLRRADPALTVLVAGDFNVAAGDKRKVGTSLPLDEPDNPSAADGYDETHALMGGGLVAGLRMTNLAAGIKRSSYPSRAGNSPIDVIYVAGPAEGSFTAAVLAPNTYGSDHLPVMTEWGR
jgi:endonuclease/exonuclease/phosphatase family metal-dependent hydrolase